jgi:hypothetical protein
MTTTTNTNGRTVRKSLADQIDRLDTMLEGLADGINETVTAVVQDAVKKAVQAAIGEVLANAELQNRLQAAQSTNNAPARPATPSFGQKLKGWIGWACAKVAQTAKKCWTWLCLKTSHPAVQVQKGMSLGWTWCLRNLRNAGIWIAEHTTHLVSGCRNVCKSMSTLGQFLWHCRKSLVIALGVGMLVGLACYLAGPVISSTVSGLAGFAGALFGSAMNALRRMLAGMSLENS